MFGLRARDIGIIIAQDELPAGFLRHEPVENGGARIANMNAARGRGGKADELSCSVLSRKAIGDRIAPVAAEIAPGDLDARRRLPPLVFGDIEHVLDALHQRFRMAALHDFGDRQFLFHQARQNIIQHVIGRQRVLVLLVLAQFRASAAW